MGKYGSWAALNHLEIMQWNAVIESSPAIQSLLRRGDSGLTVSSSSMFLASPGSVGGSSRSSQGGPSAKKQRVVPKVKGVTKSATKKATVTVVPPSVSSPTLSPPPSLPPMPQGDCANSCKFHLKYLFLAHPKCHKGPRCTFFHQRHVAKESKANLLAFVAHKCSSDLDLPDLIREINIKAP